VSFRTRVESNPLIRGITSFHSPEVGACLAALPGIYLTKLQQTFWSFSTTKMPAQNILVYLLRRDLRVEDNPVLHELTKQKPPIYTHLLPLYVFSAQQLEVSGFLPKDTKTKSPYPEARSAVGGFWRCGPHRAKFLAESVWSLKEKLEEVGSGLEIRVGMVGEVIRDIVEGFVKEKGDSKIGGVWMTEEEGGEEKKEESDVRKLCEEHDIEFKLLKDEKYFIDE
jgi:deoxyribodipyrimidine photo-lyase